MAPGVSASEHTEKIKKLEIIFPIGRTGPLLGGSEQLSEVFTQRGIQHHFLIWDGFAHDWPVWQEMVLLYIGGLSA